MVTSNALSSNASFGRLSNASTDTSTRITQKWTDVVYEIADGMNHSRCRVTGMRPVDVDHGNAEKVWNHVYGDSRNPKTFDRPSKRLSVDTPVRIDKAKGAFHKAYLPG